ncbi:MAG: serine/threonine-protein kinase [Myxococcota bacterium]
MPRVFKVHSCIGRGGFGEVYLASVYTDGTETASVALKILHADVDPRSHAVQRLRDESRMLRLLDHPSILKAQDLAVLDGRVALVTEYVEGEDLAVLAKKGPLPAPAALEIVERVADALHVAQTHEVDGRPLGLVHRDVKPENIRIGHTGEVRLLDFGVARTEQLDREAHTATDVVMGSLPYLAPEVLTTATSTSASDVYALGVTLFNAVTGMRLFLEGGPDLFGLLLHSERFEAKLEERLTRLEDPELAALVRRMVAHDPLERPSNAEVRELARELRGDAGPSLADHCRERVWPEPKSLPGLLAGRVLEEEAVDPGSIQGPGHGRRPLDPDAHSLTEITDPGELGKGPPVRSLSGGLKAGGGATLDETPIRPVRTEPSRSVSVSTTARRRSRGPTRAQLAMAITGIVVLMGAGFVGAFALGTLLLP